jgi:hypothetical protein
MRTDRKIIMAKAIVAFRNFCEHAFKSCITHTRKIGVLNDMGYEIRSTGVNVVVRVKLQIEQKFVWPCWMYETPPPPPPKET